MKIYFHEEDMKYKTPYCLFKKTLKSGNKIWYYTFYDSNGRRRQLSTGQKIKPLAIQVCFALYNSGAMYPNLPNSITNFSKIQDNSNTPSKNQSLEKKLAVPTFEEYTVDWYVYDKCEYIQQKLLHGFKISKFYAYRKRNDLEKHLIPFFGKYKIDKIDDELVEKYIKRLKNKEHLANNTINISLKTLKLILSEAYKKGDLEKDITRKINLLKNNTKTRGVLTDEEVEKLLDRTHIEDYWKDNEVYYGMNYLASKTGMRLGEIQALMKKNIFIDHILVEHSWNEMYGLGDTKSHKSRIIPITKETYGLLLRISIDNTEGDFVFSMSKGKRPAARADMNKRLIYALEKIGISKEEKDERYLSFHSWRHYVNSKLINSGVPKSIVQSIIGHVNDDAMTEHYTHVNLDEQKAVLNFL